MADEKRIERKLVQAVKDIGGLALKFVSPGFDGVPDRIVLIAYGKVAFVEVKSCGEKPRPLQMARIKKIRSLGFKVYVLDDEKQIGEIIDEIQAI
jgi:Holliday junction resolvase